MEKNYIDVLAGGGFENAVKKLKVHGEKRWGNDKYEVWRLDKSAFDVLVSVSDEEWKPEWGWWRSAEGCNIEDWPTHTFVVNGKEMKGWYRAGEDFRLNLNYSSLTDYLCEVIGASTEKNVCAVSVGLAKLNGVALPILFDKYE